MTQTIFLVTRSAAIGGPLVNGVVAILINLLDSSTDAEVIAAAIAQANRQAGDTGAKPFPVADDDDNVSGHYFDTVTVIAIGSAPLNASTDAIVIGSFDGAVEIEQV